MTFLTWTGERLAGSRSRQRAGRVLALFAGGVGARPAPSANAGVPNTVEFRTKWQIALEQIAQLVAEGVPVAPVVADAGYGVITAFRDALTVQGIPYVVGMSTETTVWAPGHTPLPPPKYRGHGRPPTLVRRTRRQRPLSVRALVQQLPAGLANRDVAPGHAGCDALALRSRPRAACTSRRLAVDAPARREAAHRMATHGSCADQVLALDIAVDGEAR